MEGDASLGFTYPVSVSDVDEVLVDALDNTGYDYDPNSMYTKALSECIVSHYNITSETR